MPARAITAQLVAGSVPPPRDPMEIPHRKFPRRRPSSLPPSAAQTFMRPVLEDVPSMSKLARQQLFLTKWYRPVALAPFVVLIGIYFKFFPNASSSIFVILILITLAWVLTVIAYSFYLLFFAVRCPICRTRFGLAGKCRSCGLPRYREPASTNWPPRLFDS